MEAKKSRYPNGIKINETKCEVTLQSLLNHTAHKVIKVTTPEKLFEKAYDYELIWKWGWDDSRNHSQYKQVFQDDQGNDGNIVCTSMVPLRSLS